ncbi:MAG: cytochrome c biogenesis protein CcsA [Acidobacteriota bacterium]
MSSVVERKNLTGFGEIEPTFFEKIKGMMPVILPLLAAIILIYSRYKFGPGNFLKEGSLTVLALICYITAATVMVTNLFVKEKVLYKLGLLTLGLGFCFNFSGWMIRWIEAGEAEGWKGGINGFWRYYPLDTLYALTLGFCCGAAIATLVIVRKPKYEFLGALALPIIAIILTIAILFGNEIRTLMPILDSYWRPIHVTVATVAYGVCLVSFGLAFAYLIKDGVRSEAIAIAVALYGLLIYGTIGDYGIPFRADYGVLVNIEKSPLPVRASLPGVGVMMAITLALILTSMVCFIIEWNRKDEKLKKLGWNIFRVATVMQIVAIFVLFFQIGQVNKADVAARVSPVRHEMLGEWLKKQGLDAPMVGNQQLGNMWLAEKGKEGLLNISAKSNPVEVGAVISLGVCLFLVALFAWKREALVEAMPSLATIDSLLYKTVGVAFPLLCILLITGAVWANESWGRYWGWDPKETGALVATMAYAAFLHTRIAHGWRGRRSAYFALVGFALVIFTWLGVSFLLVGLHSYAQV